MQKNKAFFLDRDGVIIKDIPYLNNVDHLELLPNISNAIKRINDNGYKCIVITNQSGVARGLVTREQLSAIHNFIKMALEKEKAIIDDFYYCPHHPDGIIKQYAISCDCRKPEAGLLFRAARKYQIDLSESIMIGDKQIDLEAGQKAGCESYILDTPMRFKKRTIIFNNVSDVIDHVIRYRNDEIDTANILER